MVAEAIRKLRHQTVAMEDYTSTEQKPVDKCICDVQSCDIFIGIYAFRYGFIPEGYDISITHLEYEAAGEVGIPRLIFLIDENARWTISAVDIDRTKIDEFRKIVQEHTVTFLTDDKELKAEVTAALHHTIRELQAQASSSPVPPIPHRLPYLSNRSVQESELEEMLVECADCLHQKPLVCIIHGDDQECHDTFVEKIQKDLLPEMLYLPNQPNSIGRLEKGIDWSVENHPVGVRFERMLRKLAKKLKIKACEYDLIVEELNARLNPLIIDFRILTANWQDDDNELILRWLDFWNRLPDLAYGKKLFVFFTIKYKNTSQLSFLKARRQNKKNEQVRRFIEQLNFEEYPNLSGLKFSELAAITVEDLEEWIVNDAATYCDCEQLRREIVLFYHAQKLEKICMVVLAERLRELCRKTRLPCL